MNIPFCNGTACKINSPGLHENVMKECDKLFGFHIKRNAFPGPQPVAVEKKDFGSQGGLLKKNNYVVCEKTDGERGILLLISIDSKPMCFLINRNNELLFLSLSFKREMFEGTIMDGEVIKTKDGKWNFLIHDCMFYNGRDFTKKNHSFRYAAIIDFITKRYVNKESDPFNIKTKQFFKYGNQIETTWEHIKKTTENEIDGLIFTPISEPIKLGRQYSLLKWKDQDNHTIDLLVTGNKKKITLSYTKNGASEVFKIFKPNEPNYIRIVDYLEAHNIFLKSKDSLIIEFKYSLNSEIFTPYRIRTDKSVPNSEITLNNTLKNITESIGITDFFN